MELRNIKTFLCVAEQCSFSKAAVMLGYSQSTVTTQIQQLEQEFGAENVAFYFSPVQADSAMFEMDMDEVFEQLEQRGEA